MLKVEDVMIIDQYAQGVIEYDSLLNLFATFNLEEKRNYLKEIAALIMQSKSREEDIEPTIVASSLKPTYTPCVLLRKGVANHNLQKIIGLPDNELEKGFILLLNLFKIAYNRRFEREKNNPDKWWYWDLSDNEKVNTIISTYGNKALE
jgi:hypothetical protein